MQKNEQTFIITTEHGLSESLFDLNPGDRVFFYGDLGAGKTTFIRKLLQKHLQKKDLIVRSPTYTYYQEYQNNSSRVYHFDLYRLEDIETFYMIGGTEIMEDPNSIMLIEWPEILGDALEPTIVVKITINAEDNSRIINIQKFF